MRTVKAQSSVSRRTRCTRHTTGVSSVLLLLLLLLLRATQQSFFLIKNDSTLPHCCDCVTFSQYFKSRTSILRFRIFKKKKILSKLLKKEPTFDIVLFFSEAPAAATCQLVTLPNFKPPPWQKIEYLMANPKDNLKRHQEIQIKFVCQTAERWTNPATPSQTQHAATPGRCGKPHWHSSCVSNPDRVGCTFTHSGALPKGNFCSRDLFFIRRAKWSH